MLLLLLFVTMYGSFAMILKKSIFQLVSGGQSGPMKSPSQSNRPWRDLETLPLNDLERPLFVPVAQQVPVDILFRHCQAPINRVIEQMS